ncbi:MAG: HTH-type transcriptional regulator KdgR [Lentisphaerae bacterium ADurb.Bin242]|nr:MAG: HTH-type transcriptional regulator KdgR [Lentisphaerae bacterium ADurb.Bin242]
MVRQSFSSIARELKVSTAVVSSVMRNTSSTTLASRATKQRVLESAWKHGLRLNNNVGIFVPEEVRKNEALFYPAFAGIAERCAQLGFGTFHVNSSEPETIPEFLKKRDVNGVIFWNHCSEELLNFVEEEKIPSVVLNPRDKSILPDFVSFDDYGTLTELLKYLHGKGYRKYFFSLCDDRTEYSKNLIAAHRDFLSAHAVSGRLFPQELTDTRELEEWVAKSDARTAFITLSRFDTVKVLESFAKLHKKFPADGGIVGSSVLADFYTPKLTMMVNPFYEGGLKVVDMIAEKWDTRAFRLDKRVVLKGKIIKNPSTGGE